MDVRYFLQKKLQSQHPQSKVTNLAVDNSRINNVLFGMSVNPCYGYSRKACCMDSYLVRGDGLVHALEDLKEISGSVTHAVLAIGGNDARSSFIQSFNTDQIYNDMIENGIVEKFGDLVKAILKITPKLILVYPYHPEISWCPACYLLPPAATITQLITRFIPMFTEVAH